MKHLLSIGFCLALTAAAWAIPQTITGGTVFAGRNLEQFAGDSATWSPRADLPGPWSAPAPDGSRTLTDGTVVFGLPASEVRAERSSDRLTRLRVVFRDNGKDRKTLFNRVSQSITAFTGHAPKGEGKEA